jgi:hypothetical protein
MSTPDAPPPIDPTVPHPARRYNYWLGGKDNFDADRTSGDLIKAEFPTIEAAARANRDFLRRVVTTMVHQYRVTQFLDIGAGLPSAGNTHEIAQALNPQARVVYVDNDPLVMVHARALLTPLSAAGTTSYIEADLRDPASILTHPALRDALDLTQPVGLLLIAILHFIHDTDQPYDIVQQLLAPLPTGSFLALSHIGIDLLTPDLADRFADINRKAGIDMPPRTLDQITPFFDGLQITEPGIVPIQRWRPDPGNAVPTDSDIGVYGALARKST